MSENGLITVLGRKDRLLKVRGYRVNPLDVERELLSLPGVSAGLVDVSAGGRLTLYCVAASAITGETIRAHLAKRLPHYLIPQVVPVPHIPLTSSGKPDRIALARLSGQYPGTDAAVIEDETHAVLKELAERLVKRPIQLDASFFEAGGDSLLAAVLADDIENRFGAKLQLNELVGASSLLELATVISARSTEKESERISTLSCEVN
jgi:nonribosomal peptide synthetase DhbF